MFFFPSLGCIFILAVVAIKVNPNCFTIEIVIKKKHYAQAAGPGLTPMAESSVLHTTKHDTYIKSDTLPKSAGEG